MFQHYLQPKKFFIKKLSKILLNMQAIKQYAIEISLWLIFTCVDLLQQSDYSDYSPTYDITDSQIKVPH